jgi:DNA-directed RNA polymerase specialized sigma subunit
MSRVREIPYDFSSTQWATASQTRALTAMQALMECAPGDEPDASVEELAPLREIIADAMQETLTEREAWIFDALFSRRMSLRKLAAELALSKTHIARIRDEACHKLAAALIVHPEIQRRIRD